MILFVATRNRHKLGEIKQVLADRFHYFSLDDLPGAPSTVEDENTFAGNAAKKAVELASWLSVSEVTRELLKGFSDLDRLNAVVLADDSGLEVDALNGAPGIYSARFAAMGTNKNSTDQANNEKLLRLLESIPAEKRTARFRCAIALTPVFCDPGREKSAIAGRQLFERTEVFEGDCEGSIAYAPSGKMGFGYDPLFYPQGYTKSFAELGEKIKNRISHRARALTKLTERLSAGATDPQPRRKD